MISWTTHRRKVKATAKMSLVGSMVKGIWIVFFSFLLGSLSLSFFPVIVPDALPKNATPYEMLRCFFPSELTPQFWTLVGITILLYLLLTAPFSVGMHRFFLRVSRGEKPKFRVAFSSFMSFRQILGSCLLQIIIQLLTILWGVVCFAVPFALLYSSRFLGPLALIFGVPLYLCAIPCILVAIAPFSLAPFLYAEDPSRGAFRSVRLAISRARGARIELTVFQLSFLPWKILAFGVYPFGSILLTPYIQTATAGFLDTIDTCKQTAL